MTRPSWGLRCIIGRMVNAPDTLDAVKRDLGRGLKLIADRAPLYAKGKEYYDGTRAEVFANAAISALLNAEARAHPLTLANIPVDAVIDKVALNGITAADKAANIALTEAWEANDLEDESDDWHLKAGYFGDYYVVVDPLDETEDGNATKVDVLGVSPMSSVVVYREKDGRTPLFGVRRWKEGKTPHAAVFYDDGTVPLVGTDDSDGDDPTGYVADIDDDEVDDPTDKSAWLITHEGGRMLLVHYPCMGHPYGVPLHRKAWGPQDAITKISATNLASSDALGFPIRWALLDPAADIDDDIDDDFGTDGSMTPAADKDGQTGATKGSKLRALPGAIQMLRGIKQTGQYDAAEPEGFLKNLEWYTRAMAVATGTPLFEFDLGGDQPSGESRRRASSRLNRRTRKVVRSYTQAHETLARTILAVLGFANAEVVVSFAPVETETDKEGLELVGAKVKAGVPIRVALIEAGYTAEQCDEWGYAEGTPALSLDGAKALGDALDALGKGQTLGVISEAEVAAILPTYLTMARGEGEGVTDDELDEAAEPTASATDAAAALAAVVKTQGDALGVLVRAGVDQDEAARRVGLDGLSFPNVPTTVRLPETAATGLEEK